MLQCRNTDLVELVKIGSSVNFAGLKDAPYLSLLKKHFTYWYPDCGLSWRGRNDSDEPDKNKKFRECYQLAKTLGKKIRINNLTSATNKIVIGIPAEKEIMRHRESVMGEFNGDYDCVHETLDDNGSLRKCPWRFALGYGWQEKILLWAKEINPESRLFYCDYFRTEAKWAGAYQMVSGWINAGIPIDGISIQLHSNLIPLLNLKRAEYWMRKFKDLGLIIHVPEIVVWQPAVSVDLNKLKGKSSLHKEILRKGGGDFLLTFANVERLQQRMYERIVDTCYRVQAEMIGFWSAFDSYPWNWVGNRAKAGLWDINYHPKKAFSCLPSNSCERSRHVVSY